MRLAFGLACSVATAVFAAQYLGLIPNPNAPVMEARKLQTETLAMTGSALAETRADLENFRGTLENTLERCSGLISIGVRDSKNDLAIEVGPHIGNWQMPEDGKSTDSWMFVPLFRQGKKIGQLELCYEPLVSVKSMLQSNAARLAGFLFCTSFLLFNFILYRTLKQLDPRGAVPRRVREAFDTMAEGLMILDRKGSIALANSKFGSLVGIDPEKLMAGSIDELPWQLPDDQRVPWEVALESQEAVSEASLTIKDADGVDRTFLVSAAPVLGAKGSSRGVIVTFDDITVLEDQKRELMIARKAADDANEAKSNFLSRMSHEIRTPMNAIIGYTDILQQGSVNQSDQVRYLTTIQSSGEHLLALINDILDLSKVEAGQMTVERRAIPLVPVLTQVIDTLNVKASQKNLCLSIEIEDQIPHSVETDDTRLRQILINIVGNAIKFTTEGGIRIISRLKNIDNKTMLQFDVADTGIGMSKNALETIFDPFTQADDSVTRRFGGTGLGLAISKQLTEALGGYVSVDSEEGVGTVFTITIDPGDIGKDVRWITQESLKDEQQAIPKKVLVERKIVSGHILVVDDAKANRDLAGLMLKRLGLACDFAVNGLEAIEKIIDNKYDVVLMDMNMPVMDGMTATRHLRESGLMLPIVALTALAVDEEKQKCLDAGCSDFLAKPIRQEALLETLAKYLEVVEVEKTEPANAGEPKREKCASDVIDSSVAKTLASLGLGDELESVAPVQPTNTPSDELHLPDAVRSTLPLDPEFQEIVSDFAERLVSRLGEFDQALGDNNITELKSLGHWLAGASGTVGFEEFVKPAREIERSDGSDRDRLRVLIDHINALCMRIEVVQTNDV